MFSFLFWRKPKLQTAEAEALETWKSLPSSGLSADFEKSRLVVVDVETSGLDPKRDSLLAIGAIAVTGGKINHSDSFEVVLQQQEVSRAENIIVHGITGAKQREGVPPTRALLSFLDYIGKDPLIAFHVYFDETVIKRAMKKRLGFGFTHPWLDLAHIMPALHPAEGKRLKGLDDWLDLYNLNAWTRHNALSDAMATAQLLLIAMARAKKDGIKSFSALKDVEKAHLWTGRRDV